MAKKFGFQKATSGAKSIYNKSHAGFKKANTVAKTSRYCAFGIPPLPTGSPLRPARHPTHDWIDVAPIHV